MGKTIAGFISSFLTALLGIYFLLTYFATSSEGSSPELALAGVTLILAAILCIFLLIKSVIATKKAKKGQDLIFGTTGAESMLERNNALSAEFEKTTAARQKLRTLQASAKAEEGK